MLHSSRAGARAFVWGCGLILSITAVPVNAAPLTLDEAVRLAVRDQPLLRQQDDRAAAARNRAVAARQLPDPQLVLQTMDLPVDGGEAFSASRDNFTIYSAGLMQQFTLPGKRRLRSELQTQDAEASAITGVALARKIARDAGVAWVDVWAAQQAGALITEQVDQGGQQREAATILYRSGGDRSQADVLAARVAEQTLADRRDQVRQQLHRAQAKLSRWIGAVALQRLPSERLPVLPEPKPLDALLAALPKHPALRAAEMSVNKAGTGIALARESYWPDWSLEVDYGYRPRYSDFISVTARVDLPLFHADRQDRELAAARQEAEAASERHADLHRQLAAELRADYMQWQDAKVRLQRYDAEILPTTEARTAAALAGYRAANDPLSAVLDAHEAALDVRLQRLQLAAEVVRLRLTLRYFHPSSPAADDPVDAGQE